MYCDVVNVQPRLNFSDEIIKQSQILNDGPHHDWIFDNPLCFLLSIVGQKLNFAAGVWGGADAAERLFTE